MRHLGRHADGFITKNPSEARRGSATLPLGKTLFDDRSPSRVRKAEAKAQMFSHGGGGGGGGDVDGDGDVLVNLPVEPDYGSMFRPRAGDGAEEAAARAARGARSPHQRAVLGVEEVARGQQVCQGGGRPAGSGVPAEVDSDEGAVDTGQHSCRQASERARAAARLRVQHPKLRPPSP